MGYLKSTLPDWLITKTRSCCAQFAKCAVRLGMVSIEPLSGLGLGSGLGQKFANCAYAISKLHSTFCELCRLTNRVQHSCLILVYFSLFICYLCFAWFATLRFINLHTWMRVRVGSSLGMKFANCACMILKLNILTNRMQQLTASTLYHGCIYLHMK